MSEKMIEVPRTILEEILQRLEKIGKMCRGGKKIERT